MQEKENMAVTAYDDHSDDEDMPDLSDLVGSNLMNLMTASNRIMEMPSSHLNKFLSHC